MKTVIVLSILKKPAIIITTMVFLLCNSNLYAQDSIASRLIRYEVKTEYQSAFRQLVTDYVVHSLEQENNILSEAYYEENDPSVLWIIERWSNRSVMENSSKSTQFKAVTSLAEKALSQPAKTINVKDLEPLSKQQWQIQAKQEDLPLTIMLFVDAKPGTAQTFKAVYHTAMPQFRSEPGVINYQLSQLENDSTQFVTYEKFRNEAAFQYHLNFPPIQPVLDYLNTSIKKQPFQNGLHRLIALAPVSKE